MQINEKMSAKLVIARQKKKMKAVHVAEILGVTKGYISALENGRGTISLERLNQLSELYGVEIGYFLNDSDPYENIIADDFETYRDVSPATGEDIEKFSRLLVKIICPKNASKISFYIMKFLADDGDG